MADYNVLKAAIADYVKDRTGLSTIDGDGLQETLLAIVNSIGVGYVFMGVADLTTNPGTPDQRVWYLAATAGIYANFNNISLAQYEIAVFKWDTEWHKEVIPDIPSKAQIDERLDEQDAEIDRRMDAQDGRLDGQDARIDGQDEEIADFKEAVQNQVDNYPMITIEGNVTNAPDEEDLTSVEENGNDVLKFKNRSAVDGMGYVILRKGGDNTFANQVTAANTIYEIRYDFDLDGASVTIPTGCILRFAGGKIINGTIVGQSSIIDATKDAIFDSVILSGSFVSPICLTWFSAEADETATLQNIIDVLVSSLGGVCKIDRDVTIDHLQFRGDIPHSGAVLGKVVLEGDDVHTIWAKTGKEAGDYVIAFGDYDNNAGVKYRPILKNLIVNGQGQDIVLLNANFSTDTFGCDLIHCVFCNIAGDNSIALHGGRLTDCTITQCTFMGGSPIGGIGVIVRRGNLLLDNCFVKYFKYGLELEASSSAGSESNLQMLGGAFLKCLYCIHYKNLNHSAKNTNYFIGTFFGEPRPGEQGKTVLMTGPTNYGDFTATFIGCLMCEYSDTLMDLTLPCNVVMVNCKRYDSNFTNKVNIAHANAYVTDISCGFVFVGYRENLTTIGKFAPKTAGATAALPKTSLIAGQSFFNTTINGLLHYNSMTGKDADNFSIPVSNWFDEQGLQFPREHFLDLSNRPADIFIPLGYRHYDDSLGAIIILGKKGSRAYAQMTITDISELADGNVVVTVGANSITIPVTASDFSTIDELTAYIKNTINNGLCGLSATDYYTGLRIFDTALYRHNSGDISITLGTTGIVATISSSRGVDPVWLYPNGYTATTRIGESSARPKGIGATNGKLDPSRDIGYEYYDTTIEMPMFATAIASDGVVTWKDSDGNDV